MLLCAAIRDEAHAAEAGKFRSTRAFMTIEKLITALEQQGPAHPVARALQLQTGDLKMTLVHMETTLSRPCRTKLNSDKP